MQQPNLYHAKTRSRMVVGSCQQRGWQLPTTWMAIVNNVDGSCQQRGWQLSTTWMAIVNNMDGNCQQHG